MSLTDELEKLDQLRAKGTLTEEEFLQAKAKLLAASTSKDPAESNIALEQLIVELRQQNQIAQVDREWDFQRPRYLVRGAYGMPYVPSLAMGITFGVVGALFGTFWICIGYFLPAIMNSISPVVFLFPTVDKALMTIGALITLLALARGSMISWRSIRYKRAYRDYQKKREQTIEETQ